MERKSFKQKWNEVDEVCSHCKQVTEINRGLTKQNLKKFFNKPTFQDWIIFAMLILALFGALSYQNEIQYYRNTFENPQELCQNYNQNIIGSYLDNINIQDIKIIENNENK